MTKEELELKIAEYYQKHFDRCFLSYNKFNNSIRLFAYNKNVNMKYAYEFNIDLFNAIKPELLNHSFETIKDQLFSVTSRRNYKLFN